MDFKFREQTGVGIRHFIPHASIECVHLIDQTLIYDYSTRIKSNEAREHKYFDKIRHHKRQMDSASSSSVKQSVTREQTNDKTISSRTKGKLDNISSTQNPKRVLRVEEKTETSNLVKVNQPCLRLSILY